MKKTKFKSLLILLLALLMVFALVACNPKTPDKPEPDPPEDTTANKAVQDYFQNLWEGTTAIGAAEVGEDDDLAVELGLQVALEAVTAEHEVAEGLNLGVDLKAVVGRKDPQKTAIQARIYNPANGGEILSLYLLGNDLDNIYVDFGGQQIKVSHNLVSYVYETVLGCNQDGQKPLIGQIIGMLYEKIGESEKTPNDYINAIVGSFGEGWDLSTLVNDVVGLVGFDLNDLFTKEIDLLGQKMSVAGVLEKYVGVKQDEVFKDGKVDLLPIFNSGVFSKLFEAVKTTKGNTETYTLSLGKLLLSVVKGFVPVFGNSGNIELIFNKVNNKLDDFSVKVIADAISAKYEHRRLQKINVHPEITVKIDSLKIGKLADNAKVVDINLVDYKENIAIQDKLTFGAQGITLQLGELGTQLQTELTQLGVITGEPNEEGMIPDILNFLIKKGDLELDGEIEIGVAAQLDLANLAKSDGTYEEGKENNTAFNLTVKYKQPGDENQTLVAALSFANNHVAAAIYNKDGSVKNGIKWENDIHVANLAQNFVGNVALKIKDAGAFSLENLMKAINDVVNEMLGGLLGGNNQGSNVTTTDANAAAENEFTNKVKALVNTIKPLFEKVMPMINTADGQLVVSTDNIFDTVKTFAVALSDLPATDEGSPSKWTVDKCIEALNNPPMKDLTLGDIVKMVLDMFGSEKDVTPDQDANPAEGEQETPAPQTGIKDIVLTALHHLGQYVAIDGVTVGNDSTMYNEMLKAALNSKITVSADLNNGVHARVEAELNKETKLWISESLEAVEVGDGKFEFVDVFAEYLADKAKTEGQNPTMTEQELSEKWLDVDEIIEMIKSLIKPAELIPADKQGTFNLAVGQILVEGSKVSYNGNVYEGIYLSFYSQDQTVYIDLFEDAASGDTLNLVARFDWNGTAWVLHVDNRIPAELHKTVDINGKQLVVEGNKVTFDNVVYEGEALFFDELADPKFIEIKNANQESVARFDWDAANNTWVLHEDEPQVQVGLCGFIIGTYTFSGRDENYDLVEYTFEVQADAIIINDGSRDYNYTSDKITNPSGNNYVFGDPADPDYTLTANPSGQQSILNDPFAEIELSCGKFGLAA